MKDNNIFFPDYRRYEDPVFLAKVLNIAQKFILIPVILHCYRKGHQNREVNGQYIVDSLTGIRDNLLLSESKYDILFQILIDRVEKMYEYDINNHINKDVYEINAIYKRNNSRESNLPIYDRFEKMYKGENI